MKKKENVKKNQNVKKMKFNEKNRKCESNNKCLLSSLYYDDKLKKCDQKLKYNNKEYFDESKKKIYD